MKKSGFITEISLEDFLKLNMTAYQHRRHYFDVDGNETDDEKTGEYVVDSKGDKHWVDYKGIYSKVTWDKVSLNEIVLENVKFSEEMGFKNHTICVAVHEEPPNEELLQYAKDFNSTNEEAYERLLMEYSYLDKFLTREGFQTYLIRCDVEHLYSEKRKFCTHDDYFDVPKNGTKAVYLIKY